MTQIRTLSVAYVAFLSAALFLSGAALASADAQWDTSGSYTLELTCVSGCAGTYPHTLNVNSVDLDTGAISGDGAYNPNPAISWDMTGEVDGSAMTMEIVYNNVNAGYTLNTEGTIEADGSLSGSATSSTGQVFTYESTSGEATFNTHGMITSPDEEEIVTGVVDLTAWYHDESPDTNDDAVQWAVRSGTCAVNAGANVAGNVGGFSDSYDWDGTDFSAEFDSTGLAAGMYCFVFNPTDDAGQNNVRETREFYVASSHISGGGQILEESGKRKDWKKISFGGWLADIGELVGEWEINFHNVGTDAYDKGKFHTTDFTALTLFAPTSNTCTAAMNFEADGSFNGEDGWSVIFRAGDSDNAASKSPDDTVRIELYNTLGVKVYDTIAPEFSNESSCVGTARTGLDAGNIDIVENN